MKRLLYIFCNLSLAIFSALRFSVAKSIQSCNHGLQGVERFKVRQ